jgi:hypothetical protein
MKSKLFSIKARTKAICSLGRHPGHTDSGYFSAGSARSWPSRRLPDQSFRRASQSGSDIRPAARNRNDQLRLSTGCCLITTSTRARKTWW